MIVDDRGRQLQVRPLRRLVIREHAGRAGAEPLGALIRRCGRISSRPPGPSCSGFGCGPGATDVPGRPPRDHPRGGANVFRGGALNAPSPAPTYGPRRRLGPPRRED
jgi:hypothetical protein